MTIGQKIKEYTSEHSMATFVRDSGLSRAYVYMLINNRNNQGGPIKPTIETVKRIAAGLHCSFDDLIAVLDPDIVLSVSPAEDYYIDPETARLAQELKDNPDLRVLLDASRNLNPKEMKALIAFIEAHKDEDR